MTNETKELQLPEELKGNLEFAVLNSDEDAKVFCENIPYINPRIFQSICELYGYPISVVRQYKYVDKMYRDAYYIYLSHLHFEMKRICERLALFKGNYQFYHFFDKDFHDELQNAFLGTLVIRPSYNSGKEYNLGRTLLSPYKLKSPYHYLRTATYRVTVCGQNYTVEAFPFSNQHDDVLRCAETSVLALMEYYGTKYETYSTVLPSMITNWASHKLPARALPSEGLTYRQISSLLKSFGFEPRIYERSAYRDFNDSFIEVIKKEEETEQAEESSIALDIEKASEDLAASLDERIRENFIRQQSDIDNREKVYGKIRKLKLQNLFHYYVESGVPLITAISNDRENTHHSMVVIGHDERTPQRQTQSYLKTSEFLYGDVYFIDSSSLYERYITIDDNQYPYRSQRFDHFSVENNCKVEAFIVPLYRHILLDAETAVNIIEEIFRDYNNLIKATVAQLIEEDADRKENSIDNPIILRYYLTTSRGFVSFRNQDTDYLEEKVFYNTTSFPKFIWIGEYSTLELYREGKILGEVILDATAPKYSSMGAVIAFRFGGRCVSRQIDESIEVLRDKLKNLTAQQARLIYSLYTNNLQKGD